MPSLNNLDCNLKIVPQLHHAEYLSQSNEVSWFSVRLININVTKESSSSSSY